MAKSGKPDVKVREFSIAARLVEAFTTRNSNLNIIYIVEVSFGMNVMELNI